MFDKMLMAVFADKSLIKNEIAFISENIEVRKSELALFQIQEGDDVVNMV